MLMLLDCTETGLFLILSDQDSEDSLRRELSRHLRYCLQSTPMNVSLLRSLWFLLSSDRVCGWRVAFPGTLETIKFMADSFSELICNNQQQGFSVHRKCTIVAVSACIRINITNAISGTGFDFIPKAMHSCSECQ